MNFLKNFRKNIERYNSEKFVDHRETTPTEIRKFLNKKVVGLSLSKNLIFMIMDLSKMDFDANASNSTAISDDESIHLIFQSEFAYKKDIKDFLIIAFIDQSLTNGSEKISRIQTN